MAAWGKEACTVDRVFCLRGPRKLHTAESMWGMDAGIGRSFFKVDSLRREARSFFIGGSGTIFQKAGGKFCWYFYKLADLFN